MRELHKNIFISLFFVQSSAIIATFDFRSALIYIVALLFSLYYAYQRLEQTQNSEKLKNGILVFALLLFFPQLLTGSLFTALLSLLAWLFVAINTTLKRRRELYFLMVGSFILILYATATKKESTLLLYLSIYTISSMLLLVHNYFNILRERSQIKELSEAKMATIYLSVLITILASFIYLLIPRPEPMQLGFLPAGGNQYYKNRAWKSEATNKKGEAPKQSNENLPPEDKNSQSSNEQTSEQTSQAPLSSEESHPLEPPTSENSLANTLVFYMQGEHGQYLRGKVFDYFDGERWSTKASKKEKLLLKNQQISFKQPNAKSTKYTITIASAPNRANLIYAPSNIITLYFPGNVIARDKDGTLYAPMELKKESFYSVDIESQWVAKHPKRRFSVLLNPKPYLQLPKNFSSQIKKLAQKIGSNGSNLAKSIAIENYLRNNYRYSLETVFNPKDEDALETFLLTSHYGHCEYFASSMVLMLRAIHIPARLINGYSANTYNPITGYYEVHRLDAHAWVEAYIEGEGWVSFEPTSAYTLPKKKEKSKNTAEQLETYIDKLKAMDQYQKHRTFFETLYAYGLLFFEKINLLILNIGEYMVQGVALSVDFFIHIGIYFLLLALALFYLWHRYAWVYYQKLTMKKIAALKDEDALEKMHQSLQTLLVYYDSGIKLGETPLEHAQRLCAIYPEFESTIKEFYALIDQKSYQKNTDDVEIKKIERLALELAKIKKEPIDFLERLKRIYIDL